ncbi:MAG: flagellar export chaperone FlgN [Ignavibacteria bacterium]|nr:flagellar export chaperone FlgN [Ignavibacteria bacterium]
MDTQHLVKALKQQEYNLQNFLDSLLKHQQALIAHNLPVMDEVILVEANLLKDINGVDKEVVKTINQLSAQYSLGTTSTKLLDFTKAIKKISMNDYVNLLQIQKSLRGLLTKIQIINSQNSLLIENARSFIKQTFTSLAGVNNDPILNRRV